MPCARQIDTVEVAGLHLHALSFSEALKEILELAKSDSVELVVTANVAHYQTLLRSEDFLDAYASSTLRLADGAPLVAASWALGRRLPGRVTGADLLPAICEAASGQALRVAIVGAAQGVAETASRRLLAQFPGLQIVGSYSPPMELTVSSAENMALISWLQQVEPDIVFVALGSPKQELMVHHWRAHLPRGVYLGVGAAVDFAAGTARRAPRIFQVLGLEWFWRMAHEPRRLGRRYAKNVLFLGTIVRAVLGRWGIVSLPNRQREISERTGLHSNSSVL